jgi:hypothetical protein
MCPDDDGKLAANCSRLSAVLKRCDRGHRRQIAGVLSGTRTYDAVKKYVVLAMPKPLACNEARRVTKLRR